MVRQEKVEANLIRQTYRFGEHEAQNYGIVIPQHWEAEEEWDGLLHTVASRFWGRYEADPEDMSISVGGIRTWTFNRHRHAKLPILMLSARALSRRTRDMDIARKNYARDLPPLEMTAGSYSGTPQAVIRDASAVDTVIAT